ncbi:AAA family ATPase [Botrimarina sp.]|uniref:AAA family ATPase n=1 Tax=Botrimarina sp. TaxID=2795802 RepID=UPI0032EE6AD9
MVRDSAASGDWRRVAVVGCSGSGKSTLSERLAGRLGCEHVRLDDLAFGPNWELRPAAELRRDVERIVAGERWLLDGNYRHLRDLVWRRATTLVWLDMPLSTCFRRVLLRTIFRSVTRQNVCGNNRETLYNAFATRDSILRWVVTSHAGVRSTVGEDLADPAYAHLSSRRLTSGRQADRLLSELDAP